MKWNSLYCTVWYCTVTKQNYTHGQKSWDTFAFLGRFPIHTGPTSPLTPPMVLESQLCMGLKGGGGGEEMQENFEKEALFHEGTQNDRKIWILHHCPKDFCLWLYKFDFKITAFSNDFYSVLFQQYCSSLRWVVDSICPAFSLLVCASCICCSTLERRKLIPSQVLKKANATEKKGWTRNMVQARHDLGLTEREETFTYKHINLTVKKLFKIAISTTSRMAGLAVCKSSIYNFILPAKKYEKKRPNKQGCMTEAAVFQCFPAVWGYLGYVELMSLLN